MADHSGDGDQRQEVRERSEERAVVGPGVHVLELRCQRAREAEQQRGAENAERPPVAENECREGDEPAARGHVLGERADMNPIDRKAPPQAASAPEVTTDA